MNSVDVLQDGKSFIRLVHTSGSELDVVNAARVSLHKESMWLLKKEKLLIESDEGLLNFLMREKHGTPFEQGFMSSWHIRVPIFVMREWIRHRVGYSYNEESGRYVEMRRDFYVPAVEDIREQVGKPGAYSFNPLPTIKARYVRKKMKNKWKKDWSLYELLLKEGVAKEQARIVLPLNLYTEFRWTCNARSLMNFLELRNSPHAMFEIRRYAEELEKMWAKEMPTIYQAFCDNDRIAP